jgi:adhesin transport system membrane fusion protein
VKAGQLLATLEKERAQAGFDEGRSRIMALRATLLRLQAEVQGTVPRFGKAYDAYPGIVQAQMGLFQQRLQSMKAELDTLNDSLVLSQRELDMNQKLLKSGDVSEVDVLRSKRAVSEVEGRMVAVRNKYLQEARTDMIRTEEELASQGHKLSERESVLSHTDITAPMDGIVKYLRVTTLGGVLRPGDELLQIAPTGDELIIEGKVTPADIGQLVLGQVAQVKIDAFDSSIYGGLQGELTFISPDTLTETAPNGQNMSYFRVRVKVLPTQSNPKAAQILVKPGMTASLDIMVGERTIMNYLLKPLVKTFSGALTER